MARPRPPAPEMMPPSETQISPEPDRHEVVSATRVVGGLTLVSRFGGLARDAVCSRVFGTGPEYGAFAFAFMIPNLFRRLFGEGALSAAFLPEYARLLQIDPALARRFARRVLVAVCIGLVGFVIVADIGLAFMRIRWADAGAPPSRLMAVDLTMITLPYMPLVCLTAILGAILQAHGRFAPTASAPIILSACMIVPALFTPWLTRLDENFVMRTGLYLVAWGVLASGFLQVGWSWWALRDARTIAPAADLESLIEARKRSRQMWRVMTPMVIGLGVLQINTLMDGLVASYPILIGPTIAGYNYPLNDHSNSIISYAQRLYQFPLGVFGIAVATAIFPALSRTVERADDFADTLRHGMRLSFFIGLPASIGLMLVSEPMTYVIFRGERFSADDVHRVAVVLRAFAPAVVAYSLIHILTRAFYALGDAMTPVRISVAMVGLNLALNLTLIWFLNESGLAWSTSFCSILQVILLAAALRRRIAQPVDASVRRGFTGTAIAAMMMAAAVGAMTFVSFDHSSWLGRFVELLVLTAAGLASFAVAAIALRLEEWKWLIHRRRAGTQP